MVSTLITNSQSKTVHRWTFGRGRLRIVAAAFLLVAGLLLLSEAVVTLVWQEPLSALHTRHEQSELNEKLRKAEAEALAAPAGFKAGRELKPSRVAVAARAHGRRTANGEPLGRIEIPELGVRFVFVAGVSADDLTKGPGHYSGTPLPGESGTVGIAGHRTTYLAPFRHLDELKRGDEILLRMPYGTFRYSVEGSSVVPPTDTASLRRVGHDRLALTTCTPPFSAAKRLVVTARLRTTVLQERQRIGLAGRLHP
jgi:sortase A